jgi:hypothetical protein
VNGALAVGDGQSLNLYGRVTGAGQVSIGANSTLWVDGVDSSSTASFNFAGAGGTLMLAGFHGLPGNATLTGFAPGENLEVKNVTDATYENGKLVFSNNGVDVGAFVVGDQLSRLLLRRDAARQRLLASHPRPELARPGQRRFLGRLTVEHGRHAQRAGQRRGFRAGDLHRFDHQPDDDPLAAGNKQYRDGRHRRRR